MTRFRQSFGDLLSVQALITPFTEYLIKGTFENIMWFGRTKHDYENFERTARSAYYFLEQGSHIKHKDVAQKFALIIDRVILAINSSGHAGSEAKKVPKDDADTRIKQYLEYYKVMYERLMPLICAPVVYAFGITKNVQDKDFIPKSDGKIKLRALSKMEKIFVYQDNRLAIGLNSHVRNAYAHENYTILDDAKVELWDQSWGPEVWSLDQLIELCDKLWVNALGITCALAIYDINNRKIVTERGWVVSIKLPKLRREEIKTVIDTNSNELGFYLKDCSGLSNNLSLTLSTKPKGIDQESKLYLGYENYVELFKIPTWYEEKRVIDQLIIMLYRLIPYFDSKSKVSIKVISWDDKSLGVLKTDFSTLIGLQLMAFNPKTVENIRHLFKVDTLADCTTFVEKKDEPIYVGRKPVTPKE
jgi:hypothetical protein